MDRLCQLWLSGWGATHRNREGTEIKRIENGADAVTVQDKIHRAGPTYGGKNTKRKVEADAADLAGSAKRDADAMVENAKNIDPDSVYKYEKAVEKITQKDNSAYDDWLNDQLD